LILAPQVKTYCSAVDIPLLSTKINAIIEKLEGVGHFTDSIGSLF